MHLSRNHLVLNLLFFALLMASVSCSPSRKIQKRGGLILTGNTIKTDRSGISVYDLSNFAQPKPNRKFLGLFRYRVWIYDAFNNQHDSRFNRWVRTRIGDKPVLLDSVLVDNSLIPMRVYLMNKGYFDATVSRTIRRKGARANVLYLTKTNAPFRFGEITYSIQDDSLSYFVERLKSQSLIKSGRQYDAYLLSDERERITRELKDIGYYTFVRDYLFFEIDTTGLSGKRLANIKMVIRNATDPMIADGDSLHELPHIRYFISKVYINSNQRITANDTLTKTDTLAFFGKRDSSITDIPDFYQIYRGKIRLRPEALARRIFIEPGLPFSQKDINLTYNRLQNLSLTRYVSVNVVSPETVTAEGKKLVGLLDCEIRLVRFPVNMFTIEAEGTNAGGFVGLGGSVNYRNRNIFRGAETFRVKVNGAFEIQPSLGLDNTSSKRIFNSLETGIQTGFDIPGILSPFRLKLINQNSRPKTTIAAGFNYQDRVEYLRYISTVSLGYEWSSSPEVRHLFTPLDLSSVSINRDSLFTSFLNNLKDPRFLNQYTDHLIMALKYSFVFNNQNLLARNNFFYFRINFESAGSFLNLLSKVTGASPNPEGNYTMFGIRYSQYIRNDMDFRYYKPITEKQKLVYRAALGVGVPFGNSNSLPFEKGFFTGGANGLRGWPVRSLGPGSYASGDSASFENIGDVWLEANIEYRFPLYSFLQGALFTDAGNIWLLKPNSDFTGGEFKFNSFYKTIAWDAGFGFRFDFSIFIFRIDGGLPLYNPGEAADNRWVRFRKFQLRDVNWNFGIGYPF